MVVVSTVNSIQKGNAMSHILFIVLSVMPVFSHHEHTPHVPHQHVHLSKSDEGYAKAA
jgi:hypothetical protein